MKALHERNFIMKDSQLVELTDEEYFARKDRIKSKMVAYQERIERERLEAGRLAREQRERKTDYLAPGLDKLADYMRKK